MTKIQLKKRRSCLINGIKQEAQVTINQQNKIPRKVYQIWLKKDEKSEIPSDIIRNIKNAKSWCDVNGYEHVLIDEKSEIYKECLEKSQFCKYNLENNTISSQCAISDYLRLYIINKFGGIYIDCDVEIMEGFNNFLQNNFFISLEPFHFHNDKNIPRFDVGVIGSSKSNTLIEHVMAFLDDVFYENYLGYIETKNIKCTKKQYIGNFWNALPNIIPFIIKYIDNIEIVKLTQANKPIKAQTNNNSIFEVYSERFFSKGGIYTNHNFLNTWLK